MKKSIIKSAKTKEKAIDFALEEIGKSRDEVEVEIIEEESTGFLGIIVSKDAVVRVSYEEDIKEALSNLEREIEDTKFTANEDYSEEEEPIEKEEAIEVSEVIENKEEVEEKSEPVDYGKAKQKSDIDKFYEAKDLLEKILLAMHFEDVTVIGNLEDNIIKLEAKVSEKDTGIAIGKSGSTLDAIELIIRKAIDSRRNNVRINIDINSYKKRRDEKIIDLAADTARKVQRSKKSWNLRYMNSYERRLAHEEISKHPNVSSHSEGNDPKRYVVVDYVE